MPVIDFKGAFNPMQLIRGVSNPELKRGISPEMLERINTANQKIEEARAKMKMPVLAPTLNIKKVGDSSSALDKAKIMKIAVPLKKKEKPETGKKTGGVNKIMPVGKLPKIDNGKNRQTVGA